MLKKYFKLEFKVPKAKGDYILTALGTFLICMAPFIFCLAQAQQHLPKWINHNVSLESYSAVIVAMLGVMFIGIDFTYKTRRQKDFFAVDGRYKVYIIHTLIYMVFGLALCAIWFVMLI